MPKSYNLGSKSDMNRFTRDLEKAMLNQAEASLQDRQYEIQCPHCKAIVEILPGKRPCPKCGKEINLTLNIEY